MSAGGAERQRDAPRERLGAELVLQRAAGGDLERRERRAGRARSPRGGGDARAPRARPRPAWPSRARRRRARSRGGSRRSRRSPAPSSFEAGKRLATPTIRAGSCASWKSSVISPPGGAARGDVGADEHAAAGGRRSPAGRRTTIVWPCGEGVGEERRRRRRRAARRRGRASPTSRSRRRPAAPVVASSGPSDVEPDGHDGARALGLTVGELVRGRARSTATVSPTTCRSAGLPAPGR